MSATSVMPLRTEDTDKSRTREWSKLFFLYCGGQAEKKSWHFFSSRGLAEDPLTRAMTPVFPGAMLTPVTPLPPYPRDPPAPVPRETMLARLESEDSTRFSLQH